MTDIPTFLTLVDRFCAAQGIAEATLSTKLLKAGGRIGALRAGHTDIGVKRLARAVQWLSDHWPQENGKDLADWPHGIPRPPRAAPAEGDA